MSGFALRCCCLLLRLPNGTGEFAGFVAFDPNVGPKELRCWHGTHYRAIFDEWLDLEAGIILIIIDEISQEGFVDGVDRRDY